MVLRAIGCDENILPGRLILVAWPGAAKVETALEQLSPTASLIRDARVNQ
jgi:hypothetical protein